MHRTRKIYLTNVCRLILMNMPPNVVGPQSLAALMIKRMEEVAKGNADEFNYMKDICVEMIRQTKGKEVEIYYKGKPVTKEQMKKLMLKQDDSFIIKPKDN